MYSQPIFMYIKAQGRATFQYKMVLLHPGRQMYLYLLNRCRYTYSTASEKENESSSFMLIGNITLKLTCGGNLRKRSSRTITLSHEISSLRPTSMRKTLRILSGSASIMVALSQRLLSEKAATDTPGKKKKSVSLKNNTVTRTLHSLG